MVSYSTLHTSSVITQGEVVQLGTISSCSGASCLAYGRREESAAIRLGCARVLRQSSDVRLGRDTTTWYKHRQQEESGLRSCEYPLFTSVICYSHRGHTTDVKPMQSLRQGCVMDDIRKLQQYIKTKSFSNGLRIANVTASPK